MIYVSRRLQKRSKHSRKSTSHFYRMKARFVLKIHKCISISTILSFSFPFFFKCKISKVFFPQLVALKKSIILSEFSMKEKVKRKSHVLIENCIFSVFQISKVFSLDSPDTTQILYSPSFITARFAHMERIAEQVATLCATLGEYPSVRYRR